MWKSRYDYIIHDDMGRVMNVEFPPDNLTMYPHKSGYKNVNADILFYMFAVQYYDLRINYKGEKYLAIVDDDNGAYIADTEYNPISEIYPTANDLIKSFHFSDGKRLLDLVENAKEFEIDK